MTLVHNAESAASLNLPPLDIIFGKTAAMQAVRNKLERVAETDVPVLIQGESGTGKEMCVRLLHAFSMRARGSLVKVSCPAIPHYSAGNRAVWLRKGCLYRCHVDQTRPGRAVTQRDPLSG